MTHIFNWLGWHDEEIDKQEIWDRSFTDKTFGEVRRYYEQGSLTGLFKVTGIRRFDFPISHCYPDYDFLIKENHMVVLILLYYQTNDGSWDYRNDGGNENW